MKRFVSVGLGIFGSAAARTLFEQGSEVVAVDLSESAVNRVADHVTRAVVGDATDSDLLESIGARDADASIVSTGDDISASILVTMALRDLNVNEIYVKVISSAHSRIMEKIGVTEIVFPERESAIELAARVTPENALLKYVRLGGGVCMQEMAVPIKWLGKTLRDLQLPLNYRVSVVAVHDVLTDRMSNIPSPDEPLKDSDTLVLTGTEENLAKLADLD